MKLSHSLVREILLATERSDKAGIRMLELEDYSLEQIVYHLKLMEDGELLISDIVYSESGPIYAGVERLTMKGHQFLEAAKNDTVWKKALSFAKKKGGSIPLDIFEMLLREQAKLHFLGAIS